MVFQKIFILIVLVLCINTISSQNMTSEQILENRIEASYDNKPVYAKSTHFYVHFGDRAIWSHVIRV